MTIAVDPNFPTDPVHLRVLRARRGDRRHGADVGHAGQTSDGCPDPPAGPGGNEDGCVVSGRISRLQVAGEVPDRPGAGAGPVEDWCQQYPSHAGGGLEFGADGNLYYSGGDGAELGLHRLRPGRATPQPLRRPAGRRGRGDEPADRRGRAAALAGHPHVRGDPLGLSGALIRIDPDDRGRRCPATRSSPARTRTSAGSSATACATRSGWRSARASATSGWATGGQGSWEEIDRVPDPLAAPAQLRLALLRGGLRERRPRQQANTARWTAST